MIRHVENFKSVKYIVGFSGLEKDVHCIVKKDQGFILDSYYFKGSESEFSGEFNREALGQPESDLTYVIIKKIYRIFGALEDDIPFVVDEKNKKTIDVKSIRSLNN